MEEWSQRIHPVPRPNTPQQPVPLGEGVEKTADGLLQLCVLHRLGGAGSLRDAVCQILQYQGQLAVAPLFRPLGAETVAGDAAGDSPQKCAQIRGPEDRHGIPGTGPGVADALLGVLAVSQDTVGNGVAVAAVFGAGLRNGISAALSVEIYDLMIFRMLQLLL